MRLAPLVVLTGFIGGIYSFHNMLGGFSKVNPASNDEGVELARKAVADKLSHQLGRPVKVEVLDAHSQVVAGTNYALKVKVDDSHVAKKYYDARVWAKLPAYGGAFEVTKLDEISAQAAGAVDEEAPGDPSVDSVAAYAVQQLSQQSNSLFPFQLKEVVSASKTYGDNGEKEGCVHHLKLRVSQGSMPEQVFEVEVVESPHGHALKSSKQLV